MFKNFLRISLRNFLKNKSNTFINITGLSLGITCSLIIYLIISFELSFNTSYKSPDNIYRVTLHRNEYGHDFYTSGVPYPFPVAFRNDFNPQHSTFIDGNFFEPLVRIRGNDGKISKFKQDLTTAFVDQDYFEIFNQEWLRGSKKDALVRPNTAVISETLAKKYFGTLDAVGRTFNFQNETDFEVTGVIKDPPLNSDFQFHMLLEIKGSKRINDNWGSTSSSVQFFVKTKNKITNEQLTAFVNKYKPNDKNIKLEIVLQPLNEHHLDDRYDNFNTAAITKESLWALGCIGIFLILMACINYINLNTAIAISRAKEVGIRKVLGGKRSHIIWNFLIETSLLVFFSIILSITISELALDKLDALTGYKLSLSLFSSSSLVIFLAGIFLFVSLFAGLYPSIYLSGFKSLQSVTVRVSTSDKNSFMRKFLVVTQFAIAHIIIIGTIIVVNQVDYFKTKDLGYNKEAIVEVPIPHSKKEAADQFKNELAKIPPVISYTLSNTGASSSNLWTSNFKYTNKDKIIEDRTETKIADKNYFSTYGLTILSGTQLSESDSISQVVVNESFVKAMGLGKDYNSAVGKIINTWGKDVPIVGVIKNFNSLALHQEVTPLLVMSSTEYYHLAAIKINMANGKSALDAIESAWNIAYPEYVYEYAFLDETIAEFYEREVRTSTILNTFSFIAILISCMGLFGLASYSISNKTKEIGIRKVLGASISNILSLITFDFFKLIIAGFVIAIPVAYYFMQLWLDEYAYKITIGPSVFIIAILFTSLIAIVTVGYKSLKAATANPVKSLKYE